MKTRYGPHELKLITVPVNNQIFNKVYVVDELIVLVTTFLEIVPSSSFPARWI